MEYLTSDDKFSCYTMCFIGKSLFVAGGKSSVPGQCSCDATLFDHVTNHWKQMPRITHATNCAVTGAIGNKVYVAGITRATNSRRFPTEIFQIYHAQNGTWEIGPPMPDSLCGKSDVAIGGDFYTSAKS